jgi:magnesium transporter
MNVPYPGAGEQWGVALSGGLVVAMSFALYMLFRKRGWL